MSITHYSASPLFSIALAASQAYEVRHAVGLVAKSRRASSRSVSSSQTDNYLALSVRRDDDCRGLPLYQTNQGTSKIGAPQRRRSIESLNFTNFEINDQKYNIEHKSKICTTHSTDDIDNDEIQVDEIENQNQELQSYVPSSIVLESGTGTPQHSRRHSDDFLQTTNAIDDMGKLNQISLSIERLAEKLSGSLSEQYSDQFSHIDLSADKNQMPYDSIVGIDSIPDDRRHFMPYEKRVFAYPFPVSYTGNIDNCDRYHATDEHFEEYHGRGETSKDNFAFRGDSSKESRAATDQKALTVDNIDNNVSIMINSFQDFENSNLRSSVECASEHANRLSLAASRYGIFR